MPYLTPWFYAMNFSLNSLESLNPELSPQTRFFKFRPFCDLVELFEVDPFPVFFVEKAWISAIICEKSPKKQEMGRLQTAPQGRRMVGI